MGDLRKSLSPRDERILEELARHRFLSVQHLHQLVQPTGSYKKLQYRLQRLYHHRFVDRPRAQLKLWEAGAGRKPYVYALGDEGAKYLKKAGQKITSGVSRWTKKNREVGEPYLAHTLMINNFYVALKTITDEKRVDLSWLSESEFPPDGKRIYVSVIGPQGGRAKIPIKPDAYFTLSWKEKERTVKRHFFLEADQGTMPVQRRSLIGTSLYKKYLGYWHWGPKRKLCKKYDIPGFLVLTVTKTAERADNLRLMAREVDDRRQGSHLFWSTSEEQYADYKNILKAIWMSSGDPDGSKRFHSLIEASASTR